MQHLEAFKGKLVVMDVIEKDVDFFTYCAEMLILFVSRLIIR